MSIKTAKVIWEGDLKTGNGNIETESGALKSGYSFGTRFQDGKTGTNPEELIAAAHASCFSMALAHALTESGHPPRAISTEAKVHLHKTADGKGFEIPSIELITSGDVPGIDKATFTSIATHAKENCPVSKVLAGARITLQATLST